MKNNFSPEQRGRLLRHPWGWIGGGFGGGFSPFAPGTVGSAMALLPYVLMRDWGPWAVLSACVIGFVLGVRAADWVIHTLSRQDPAFVVMDEWVGQWLTLLPATLCWPLMGFAPPLWAELLIGFLLFRLLDIIKIWPASWADQKVHGGLGAMLDDAFAGLQGALLMTFALPPLWRWLAA